eukprot:jgi/Phyca11/20332/fgenesh1_pg.PHYCAscaffold_62_\
MTDLWRDEEEDEEKDIGENLEEEVEVKTEVTAEAPSEGRMVGDLGLVKTEPGEQKDFVSWNAPDKEERAQRSLGKVAKVLRVVSPKKEKMTVASMRTSVPTQAVKAKTVASKPHLSVPRNSSTGYRTVSKPPLTVPSAGTQYVHNMRSGGAGHLRNAQLERKIGPVVVTKDDVYVEGWNAATLTGCENSTVFDEDDVSEKGYVESIGDEWSEEEGAEAGLEEADELQEGSLNGGEAVGEQSEVMTPVERTVVVDQGPEQNLEVLDAERIVHVKWEKARKRASLSPVAAAKEVVKTVLVSRAVPSPSSVKESPIYETEVAVQDKKVDSGVQWASESVGSEMTNSWKVVHSWDKTKTPLKSILKKDEVREDALSSEGLRLVEDTA